MTPIRFVCANGHVIAHPCCPWRRAAWKYLGLAVLCGAILWASTILVYLIFAGKAH